MIRCEKLSVSLHGRAVLEGVDFDVGPRGLHAVLGPSGGGKSTLLKVLSGQLDWARSTPNRAARSDVVIDGLVDVLGRPLEAWDPVELRRRVVMVLQEAVPLPGSVKDNLQRPQRAVRPHRKQHERDQDMQQALQMAGLAMEVDPAAPAATLSGGQMQRLAMARAMMMAPSALLLDEPTSALDNLAVQAVCRTLRGLAERMPVVVVTHDERLAWRSDRLLFLARPQLAPTGPARVLAQGRPDDLLVAGGPPELTRFVARGPGEGE